MYLFLPDVEQKKGLPVDCFMESSLQEIMGDSTEAGDVVVSIQVSAVGKELLVRGVIMVTTVNTCSKCLEEFKDERVININEAFTMPAEVPTEIMLKSMTFDSAETLAVKGDYLYIDEYVRQQIILEEEIKPICNSACKGICARCGVNLNVQGCECDISDNGIDERLLKLKNLKLDS